MKDCLPHACLLVALLPVSVQAESPAASYIFPAGGQRGTEVDARVGGFYFHGRADFHWVSPDITARSEITQIETIWFEGPMIFQPDSQQKEDYPQDHFANIKIDPAASLGVRTWFCETDQGTTPDLKFVIGELPEIVEHEIDGDPIPQTVTLPVTINGRVFPREDVDVWEFAAAAGDPVVCSVAARQLGYPLEASLKVIGPNGRAIDAVATMKNGDPELAFVAAETGKHQIRVNDANYGGLQNYVYRLTIRRGHRITGYFPIGGQAGEPIKLALATSDGKTHQVPVTLPSQSRAVPITIGDHTELVPLHVSQPGAQVVDGRIDQPGKFDSWPLVLTAGQTIACEVFAHDFGSRLDSLLTIEDDAGNEVAKNDDGVGGPDSHIVFTAKKAGNYVVQVRDQFSSRGGVDFGYRLMISPIEESDFQLQIASDPVNVQRITNTDAAAETPPPTRGPGLAVTMIPQGAFKHDVELSVEGLPAGVELEGTTLSFKRKKTEILFKTRPDTPLATTEITLVGVADLGDGKTITRRAKFPIRLSIVPSVPFKYVGNYWVTNDHPCGSVLVKRYAVERSNGFTGPLRAMLADRQIRHLQGVSGPIVEIAAEQTSFDYPITFPPSMELGRTSRVQLMLVGEVDGKTVSYTTGERNEQMITVTTEGLLNIASKASTVAVRPGESVEIPIVIRRHVSLANRPILLHAQIPKHFHGISAEPIEIDGSQSSATLRVTFATDANGPFNMPLTILAQTTGQDNSPHTAEAKVELVPFQ